MASSQAVPAASGAPALLPLVGLGRRLAAYFTDMAISASVFLFLALTMRGLRGAGSGDPPRNEPKGTNQWPLVLEILLGVSLDQRREPSHHPVYEREEGLARLRGKNVGGEGTTGTSRIDHIVLLTLSPG